MGEPTNVDQYIAHCLELDRIELSGADYNGPEAEAIREKMDLLWYAMSEAEHDELWEKIPPAPKEVSQ